MTTSGMQIPLKECYVKLVDISHFVADINVEVVYTDSENDDIELDFNSSNKFAKRKNETEKIKCRKRSKKKNNSQSVSSSSVEDSLKYFDEYINEESSLENPYDDSELDKVEFIELKMEDQNFFAEDTDCMIDPIVIEDGVGQKLKSDIRAGALSLQTIRNDLQNLNDDILQISCEKDPLEVNGNRQIDDNSENNDIEKEGFMMHGNASFYRCLECNLIFVSCSKLEEHMKIHQKKKCQCDSCKLFYESIHFMNSEKPYYNPNCDSLKGIDTSSLHKCDECHKTFISKEYLAHHMRTHTEKKKIQCKICRNLYLTKNCLKKHLKYYHTNIKLDSNDLDDNEVEQVEVVGVEKRYRCCLCRKDYYSYLPEDKVTFDGKNYKCSYCQLGNVYSFNKYLNSEVVDDEKGKLYTCNVCFKSVRSYYYLAEHMQVHSDEKPYQCSLCLRSYKYRKSLNEHLRSHDPKLMFECDICNKHFTRRSHLQDHHMVHESGQKPHTCYVCGKGFMRKNHLNTHLQIHKRSQQMNS